MENNDIIHKPSSITFDFIKGLIDNIDTVVVPCSSIYDIPNISVPEELVPKGKVKKNTRDDHITRELTTIFNRVTNTNYKHEIEQLKTFMKTINTTSEIIIVVNELIHIIYICDNIDKLKIFLEMINSIANYSTKNITDPTKDKKLGYFFLNKIRDELYKYFSSNEKSELRELVNNNVDGDIDLLDKYTKTMSIINHLIMVVCVLYGNKGNPNMTSISISSQIICSLMMRLINEYNMKKKDMAKIGNPFEEDCSDEDEYFAVDKECKVYLKMILYFIEYSGANFIKDTELQQCGDGYHSLNECITIVEKNIIANIDEEYFKKHCMALIAKVSK